MVSIYRCALLLCSTLLLAVAAADLPAQEQPARAVSDSAAVVQVIEGFHAALESADSAGALALLAEHAVILESGGFETREEYRSHHLPADIAFAGAVPREVGPVRVVVRGDVAWASSTSTSRGTFRDRAINSRGAELMVLERGAEGWRIAAIHWSSREVRSSGSE
jgi:ketosteroid isomerase-like protein